MSGIADRAPLAGDVLAVRRLRSERHDGNRRGTEEKTGLFCLIEGHALFANGGGVVASPMTAARERRWEWGAAWCMERTGTLEGSSLLAGQRAAGQPDHIGYRVSGVRSIAQAPVARLEKL